MLNCFIFLALAKMDIIVVNFTKWDLWSEFTSSSDLTLVDCMECVVGSKLDQFL